MRLIPFLAGAAVPLFLATVALAAPPSVKVETVADKLSAPMGLAVRPGLNELYISESGAGQIVRLYSDRPGAPTVVVTGFPTRPFASDAKFNVGPLGLTFLDRQRLVVGTGGASDGRDVVCIFAPPLDEHPLAMKDAKQTLGPLVAPDGGHHQLGSFFGVVATPYALFVSTRGDDGGWIARSIAPEGMNLAGLQPAISTKALSGVGGPTALVVSKRGELIAAEIGDPNKPKDTRLGFYDPKPRQGRLLLSVPTGLPDIAGLAYSSTGMLYAIVPGWRDGKDAGLYRIDAELVDGKMSAKSVKIVDLERPTALAFTADGTLFVTVLGSAAANGDKSGSLVKIVGSL